jgi:hypothetical protein
MRFAEPAAKPCSQPTWPETDRICQKWTAPQRAGAHKQDGAAAEPSPADTQPVVRAESAPGTRPARATASRSAQNARAAQHRKAEGLQMMRGFGDNLSDVPASAYSPDGTRRTSGGNLATQCQSRTQRRAKEQIIPFVPVSYLPPAMPGRAYHPILHRRS